MTSTTGGGTGATLGTGTGTLRITLPVEGMTCAACQATVQRALNKAPGVEKAAVNLMTNEATVLYHPDATTPAALVDAINDTGYVSHLPRADAPAADNDHAERALAGEYATLRNKSIVSLALGAVAMAASRARNPIPTSAPRCTARCTPVVSAPRRP